MATEIPLQDFEEAEHAFERVRPELEALNPGELSPLNVDLVGATSIVLGVADRVISFRDRMAKLPEFEVRNVDKLVDYAKAAWFAYVTNLPVPEAEAAASLIEEVAELRGKLLMWATPLVGSGVFEESAIAKIKEGSGSKDAPSDLVALVGLYRSRWDAVKNICGVTEADLTRGAQIGPAVFAAVSRREFRTASSTTDGSLRVRRAWTLLDRAYTQCRRALAFLRAEEGDADTIAPSLRRNPGPAARPSSSTQSTSPAPNVPGPSESGEHAVGSAMAAVAATADAVPRGVEAGAVVGSGAPFRARS